MSFLQPILLAGLPLALLPVLIHLIHRHRHRTVRWAAMMFLLDARKMTKGLARLRQILILAMRVLAVGALVFAASRPLSGGWIGFGGGRADTLLILLDRSASMEQKNLESGVSKRSAALDRLAGMIETTGTRGEIVLIDSATLEPILLKDADALRSLPATAPTATAADIPTMLRRAIDHLAANASGRADLWLVSDLRQADWNPASGEWDSLRSDLAAAESLRLFLLAFPELPGENHSITLRGVKREDGPAGRSLVMDLLIRREGKALDDSGAILPLEVTLNGTRTVEPVKVQGGETALLGHRIALWRGNDSGWGRLDLPADDNPADNSAFFVFDEPAPRLTVVLSDDLLVAEAIRTAATAATESGVSYEALVLPTDRAAQIPWEETALLFWHAPLPAAGSNEAALLEQHAASGRSLVLLPPDAEGGGELFGVKWGNWIGEEGEVLPVEWWRTESGLLSNTRSGAPLPVAEVSVSRARTFEGETLPLLRLADDLPLVARVLSTDQAPPAIERAGPVYLWGTLPRSDRSNLASQGVVFFVMTHRALEAGADAVSRARLAEAGPAALAGIDGARRLDNTPPVDPPTAAGLAAGAWAFGPEGKPRRLLAVNRPPDEDLGRVVSPESLAGLLAGVDYRRIDDSIDGESKLASEIWRIFLAAMALALLAEAILCLPPRAEREGTLGPIRPGI